VKVTFLGTGGSFPTERRNVTSHAVWVQGETLLFDCGEGAQRQLRRSRHRFSVDRVFLSHLHLDHVLGLPGYLGTLSLLGRENPLRIYTPRGTNAQLAELLAWSGRIAVEYTVEELDDGDVVRGRGFRVVAARVDHAGPSLGFRVEEDERPGRVDVEKARALGLEPGPRMGELVRTGSVEVNGRILRAEECVGPVRPGRILVYSGDTRKCRAVAALARGADLLIHESTYTIECADEALARGHATCRDAAEIAQEAGVRRLAIAHVSPRHQEPEGLREMLAQARDIFAEVRLPSDLEELEIPVPDEWPVERSGT